MATKEEIKDIRDEIIHGTPKSDGRRGSGVGDPVSNKATNLVENRRLMRLEETSKAIEEVYRGLPTEKRALVMKKYWDRPQRLTDEGICDDLKIGKSTFYRWRDEILKEVAERLGLVGRRRR